MIEKDAKDFINWTAICNKDIVQNNIIIYLLFKNKLNKFSIFELHYLY